jgi:hypothetical protein
MGGLRASVPTLDTPSLFSEPASVKSTGAPHDQANELRMNLSVR